MSTPVSILLAILFCIGLVWSVLNLLHALAEAIRSADRQPESAFHDHPVQHSQAPGSDET